MCYLYLDSSLPDLGGGGLSKLIGAPKWNAPEGTPAVFANELPTGDCPVPNVKRWGEVSLGTPATGDLPGADPNLIWVSDPTFRGGVLTGVGLLSAVFELWGSSCLDFDAALFDAENEEPANEKPPAGISNVGALLDSPLGLLLDMILSAD